MASGRRVRQAAQSRQASARAVRPCQRGAALLLAMTIVVLVSTVVAGMVWQQNRAVQVEGAERARAQAAWILSGALDWARLILREDLRDSQRRGTPYDALDEPWATPLAEARLSSFLAADRDNNADGGPEAFVSGAIVDAQSRFNLRGLVGDDGKVVEPQVQALRRLCALGGLPEQMAERIAAGLAAAFAVATAEAPAPADPPLRPVRLEDLAWLGVDRAAIAVLAPWVDLLPARTPVNVNTAPREALVAAFDGVDVAAAERLVQARQRAPLRSLGDVERLLPGVTADPTRVAVATSYFVVVGRLRLEDRLLEVSSLLVRRDGRVEVLRSERRSHGTTAGVAAGAGRRE